MTAAALPRFAIEPVNAPVRGLLVVAVVIAAIAHAPVIAPHLEEAPYMGALFILLTAACAFLGTALCVRDSRLIYSLVVLTCGLAVLGYVATRVVAFPVLADDVGNWFEPLGVVSIVSEALAVALAAGVLLRRR